jgi:endonuclease/exonuclease/phosphatase family metal-dependent hydrolase
MGAARGAFQAFPADLSVLAPGRSFPARRPLGQLDRIVVSAHWAVEATGVHHSAAGAAGVGSPAGLGAVALAAG